MNDDANPFAAIWQAITVARKHQLERLKAENAALRAQLILSDYEQHRKESSPEKLEPNDAPQLGFAAWRRRPRRKRSELFEA
jgi:hypothetical protein